MSKQKPIIKNFPHIIHGGDYNPDQWQHMPEVLDKDIELWKDANMNSFSVGIFSWSMLEPDEGKYDFSFLDDVLDRIAEAGGKAVLATPSGARPHWLAQKYPEVLRVNARREKMLFGARHNHCFTSPVYREKVRKINTLLAERYKDHPALGIWHISNEFGGECHCELCQIAFRKWLKERYNNDLQQLNLAWWNSFWSHTVTDWEQIESPSPIGEGGVHGLNLDWQRFVTHQTIDFIENEIEPIKRLTQDIPVTTNLMGFYPGLNCWKMREVLDVISWDNYPEWHNEEDPGKLAAMIGMTHDLNRSLLNKPFMLMESSPSSVNWKQINNLLRPGMHTLAAMQAVSHGADTVQYFQFRKSRGSSEKFHAAVVDHVGHGDTRVYREIQSLGKRLQGLDEVVGTQTACEMALVIDWENRWSLEDARGYKNEDRKYIETCRNHYYPFWKNGISMDIIDSEQDFSKYKLVIMPMLYMIKSGVEQKIAEFVKSGGTVVMTYISGIVDESDLCYLGGWPAGELKEVFGIWSEEIDSLHDSQSNAVTFSGKVYKAVEYCDLIHANTAEVLGSYQKDFYAGMPAVTCNTYGKGKAYYVAFRDDGKFLSDFYDTVMKELNLTRNIEAELPENVTAQRRDGIIFLKNFGSVAIEVIVKKDYIDFESGEKYTGICALNPYEVKILQEVE